MHPKTLWVLVTCYSNLALVKESERPSIEHANIHRIGRVRKCNLFPSAGSVALTSLQSGRLGQDLRKILVVSRDHSNQAFSRGGNVLNERTLLGTVQLSKAPGIQGL